MKDRKFGAEDLDSVIAFSQVSKLVYDAYNIQAKAEVWLFKHFPTGPI